MPATHFSEDPPQVINQRDLDLANEKLKASHSNDNNGINNAANADHINGAAGHNMNGSGSDSAENTPGGAQMEKVGTFDKYEITEDDCYEELGYSFPTWKKWYILTVIFWVQVSMNFNTSLYSNAIPGITEEFGVSDQAARCGAMIFLVLYAFGCELWAPWSEEFGRWPVLQLSLFLVNIWQLPVALAPNFASIMVGRALGGLSSAGGSVTLGMIADLWEADVQQYAVAYVVFSSVGGSVLGPIVGGFTEKYLDWRYVSFQTAVRVQPLTTSQMVHLGAAHPRRLCPNCPLPHRPRDPHHHHDEPHRQAPEKGEPRCQHLGPRRAGALPQPASAGSQCRDSRSRR